MHSWMDRLPSIRGSRLPFLQTAADMLQGGRRAFGEHRRFHLVTLAACAMRTDGLRLADEYEQIVDRVDVSLWREERHLQSEGVGLRLCHRQDVRGRPGDTTEEFGRRARQADQIIASVDRGP